MFDDFKDVIEKYSVPEPVKYVLNVSIKLISSSLWAFLLVGLCIDKQYFPYWLAFVLIVLLSLFATIIRVLLILVESSLKLDTEPQNVEKSPPIKERKSANSILSNSWNGIIGNVAFYSLFFIIFSVLKIMGVFDAFFQEVLNRLNH